MESGGERDFDREHLRDGFGSGDVWRSSVFSGDGGGDLCVAAAQWNATKGGVVGGAVRRGDGGWDRDELDALVQSAAVAFAINHF